jgi:hypothetical protein
MRLHGVKKRRWTGLLSAAALAVGLLVVALAATAASAKVRSGTGNDPRESALPADRDIEQVRASYDDLTGRFSIAVRFYGAVSTAGVAALTIDFGPQSGGGCSSVRPTGATFLTDTDPNHTTVTLTSWRFANIQVATKTTSSDRREVRIAYTRKQLAGMDLRCAQAYARIGGVATFDQLDSPIFFAGPFRTVVPVCVVPKVVGKPVAKARTALDNAGCELGTAKRVRSARVKAGLVVSQKPVPGRRLALGSRVNLTVSRGNR